PRLRDGGDPPDHRTRRRARADRGPDDRRASGRRRQRMAFRAARFSGGGVGADRAPEPGARGGHRSTNQHAGLRQAHHPGRPGVRTIDGRLVDDGNGWRFERLASGGGAFETIEHLNRAHEVATDPRIEMPDSARLDILAGLVSPVLLDVMSQLADVTPYGVTVLATGHPHNVFETDRQSHHTVGRAVDIHRIGDTLVIDDHEEGSPTMEIMRWMLDHPDVRQVGGPWDLDGKSSSRSFTNTVHLDHVHLAVNVRRRSR